MQKTVDAVNDIFFTAVLILLHIFACICAILQIFFAPFLFTGFQVKIQFLSLAIEYFFPKMIATLVCTKCVTL